MSNLCMGRHRFDTDSGWCSRCGCARADGRAMTPGGKVLIPGTTRLTTTPAHIRFELGADQ